MRAGEKSGRPGKRGVLCRAQKGGTFQPQRRTGKLGEGLSQAPALTRAQSPGGSGCTWAGVGAWGGRCRRLGEGLWEKWGPGKGAVLAGLPVLLLGRFNLSVMFWTSTQRTPSGLLGLTLVQAALLVTTCDVDHLCLIHEEEESLAISEPCAFLVFKKRFYIFI